MHGSAGQVSEHSGRTKDSISTVEISSRLATERLPFVDGLRALAILAVVAFHARVTGFHGGFVGVDIFLVISGFLITRQIAGEAFSGRFRALDFYARRVLRILPPLLLVAIVTLVLGRLFPLLPQELEQLDMSVAAAAVMISNYYFASGTEYFASGNSEIQPLLHTWSLGLEEQYYLLAPWFVVAVMTLAAYRKRSPAAWLIAAMLVIVALSYGASGVITFTDHRLAFYSIFTRAWQFAAGGILAIAFLRGLTFPEAARLPASLLAIAAIAASILLFGRHTPYPGFVAVVPTAATMLILAAGIEGEHSPLIGILASRPAVVLGLISYSWYLWHVPLLTLTRSLDVRHTSLSMSLFACAIALGLSVPTYLLVERPSQNLRRRRLGTGKFARSIVLGGVGASALLALVAFALAMYSKSTNVASEATLGQPLLAPTACRPAGADVPTSAKSTVCLVGSAAAPSVLFWGDSHAERLTPIADWAVQQTGRSALVLASMACPPLPGIEVKYFARAYCENMNGAVLRWLNGKAAGQITGVVLVARWPFYDGDDSPSPNEVAIPRVVWHGAALARRQFGDMLRERLESVLDHLPRDAHVLLMAPVPEFAQIASRCILRARLYGGSPLACAMTRAEVEERRQDTVDALREVAARRPGTRLVDPLDVFCDRDKCVPFGERGAFYADENHITPLGAEMIYRAFQRDFLWVSG